MDYVLGSSRASPAFILRGIASFMLLLQYSSFANASLTLASLASRCNVDVTVKGEGLLP